jgi:hypothetical protein
MIQPEFLIVQERQVRFRAKIIFMLSIKMTYLKETFLGTDTASTFRTKFPLLAVLIGVSLGEIIWLDIFSGSKRLKNSFFLRLLCLTPPTSRFIILWWSRTVRAKVVF